MERGVSYERQSSFVARRRLAAFAIAAVATLGIGVAVNPELRTGVAEFVDPMWPEGGLKPLFDNPTIER